MLKFTQLSRAQRLFVVCPDFRSYVENRFPVRNLEDYPLCFVRGKWSSRWLRVVALEYLRESGIISQKRARTSFALDTLVAFCIGQISARYRTTLSQDLEWSAFISLLEHEEALSLGFPILEVLQWAQVVYGRKPVDNTRPSVNHRGEGNGSM